MGNFLTELASEFDEDFFIAAERKGAAEFSGFIDTGCYLFNAVLSGSLYGGLPNNKITAIAGEPATGKSFLTLGIVKHFLDSDKKAGVAYFDTEGAITVDMLEERGIDSKRVLIGEPDTVQNFRTKAIKIIDAYEKQPESKRGPFLMVLDSLGMLSTTKEMEDTAEGKETRDMTKAQIIKATFRVLTLRLAKAKIPLIVTNHVYDVTGAYVPTKTMGGGCVVAGTKVKTNNGLVKIEELTKGDKVETLFGYREILETFKFSNKDVYEIEFEDGTKIKCSGDHKFLVETENGFNWKEAKNIISGTILEAKN
jgi:RecA/RadA recombinase